MKINRLLSICCLLIVTLSACHTISNLTPNPVQVYPKPTRIPTNETIPYPLPPTPLGYSYPAPFAPFIATFTPYPYPAPSHAPFIDEPLREPTHTPLPHTPTPTLPSFINGIEPYPIQVIRPDDFIEGNNILHDVILIYTKWPLPFNYEKYGQAFRQLAATLPTLGPDEDYKLWAISPDGTRMGRISPIGLNTMMFLPDSSTQKPIVVEYGIYLNNPNLIGLPLPDECYAYKTKPLDDMGYFNACRYFKFSPDGRYFSFTFGEFSCGRILYILDVQTGNVVYHDAVNSEYPEFLANGKAFVKIGHCEGGTTLLVDLKTGKEEYAGDYAWQYDWNMNHTAFLVQVHPYQGLIGQTFWGYVVHSDRLFSPGTDQLTLNSPAVWVPAGTDIIYEQRELMEDPNSAGVLPKSPSRIVRLNPETGATQVILSDPQYDFLLCGRLTPCLFNRPDWVQVKRIRIPSDPMELASYQAEIIACLEQNQCSDNFEIMALNWRTGELRSWTQLPPALPTATPTQQFLPRGENNTPLPPDPGSKLVYRHPSGDYSFFVGADGTSLWKVTKNSPPELWVENATNYIYLP